MPTLRTMTFAVRGMHCPNCESTVEMAIKHLAGVQSVAADYGAETVEVCFDPRKTDLFSIFQAVELKGYECSLVKQRRRICDSLKKLAEILIGFAGIGLIFLFGLWLEEDHGLLALDHHLSHGMIFVVGLFTGFHCVGMCGGLIVGYTLRSEPGRRHHALSHIAYGLGKTIAYTLLGASFGYLGSLITFTRTIRSTTAILAGLFLILFGLNMLHLLPHFRVFGMRMPRCVNRYVYTEFHKHHSPLIIGLLNGLMIACGPLQAMYVMAAATGSAMEGAITLFLFGAGTLPLLMGFGLLASLISNRMTNRFLQASGALVVALGLIMLNRGLLLNGSGYDFRSAVASLSARIEFLARSYTAADEEAGVQIIRMQVIGTGYQPDRFVLRKGVPVKWIIDGKKLNDCNRRIIVPKLGLTIDLKHGEQIVEFTPDRVGIIPWSCWMGMIPGSFVVEDDQPPGKVPEDRDIQ